MSAYVLQVQTKVVEGFGEDPSKRQVLGTYFGCYPVLRMGRSHGTLSCEASGWNLPVGLQQVTTSSLNL